MSPIRTLVVCDDIRREISGKDILIGVYSGSIVVNQFPFVLGIAIWMEYAPSKIGVEEIHLSLSFAGKPPAKIKAEANFANLDAVGLPITGLQFHGDAPGEFVIEYSPDGKAWEQVSKKTVVRGEVTNLVGISPPAPPTAPST